MAKQEITVILPDNYTPNEVLDSTLTMVGDTDDLNDPILEMTSRSNNTTNQQPCNKKKTYQKQGNPYKRGNTWTYIYYVIDPATGKKQQKRKGGFKTKKEASQALKETEALILTGQYVSSKKQIVGEYINNWFLDIHKHRLQPNTVNGYKVNIENHIIPGIGSIPLDKLCHNDISRFYSLLMTKKKLSPTTIKYIHSVLRKSLKEAVLSNLILKNLCEGITLPKKKKYKATILNQEQIKSFIKNTENSEVYLEVLLALTLGLRRGEVLGLRIPDIDFEKHTLHVCQQVTTVAAKTEIKIKQSVYGLADLKTEDSHRILYVPEFVLKIIHDRIESINRNKALYGVNYHNNYLLCCNEDGRCMNPNILYKRFKNLLKENNLPDIRFHDLRHSYATALLELDVPLKIISYQLGHSSINITADIYCHLLDKIKLPADIIHNVFK